MAFPKAQAHHVQGKENLANFFQRNSWTMKDMSAKETKVHMQITVAK